jgi:ParB-like nuclease family protein
MTADVGGRAVLARKRALTGALSHQTAAVARPGISVKERLTGIQTLPLTHIKPNPWNPKTHSAKQIRQIANSIVAFGFTNPLLVYEHGELIAGHGRYQAAQLLGLTTVPVIVAAGLSRAKRRALAIADNKIAENAGWDRERLALEIPELTDLLGSDGLTLSLALRGRGLPN